MIKYFLINDKGEEWDFQPTNHDGQLQNVDGEGFKFKREYSKISEYYLRTASELEQGTIKGEVVFITTDVFNAFRKFIQSTKLILKRVSHKSEELYADVDVILGENKPLNRFKEEISIMDIDFAMTSPWQKTTLSYEYVPVVDDVGKTYAYTYPFQYVGNIVSQFAVESSSDVDDIVNVKIMGETENPTWGYFEVLKDRSVIRSTGTFNGTIGSDEYLYICSEPNALSVTLRNISDDSMIRNVYNECDINLDTFMWLKKTPSRNIFFVRDALGNYDVPCRIEVKQFELYP